MTAPDQVSEAELPLDPARVAICAATRVQLASAGDAGVPPLLHTWEAQPSVRHGVIVTFGMMLWYADSASRPLSAEHRILARRHLLRAAVAEESWHRQAFLEAAEWTHDSTYHPLVSAIEPRAPVAEKLARQKQLTPLTDLLAALREQYDGALLEGWVPDEGLARSVRSSFTSAAAALATHDHRAARAALTAAKLNLGLARGKGVRQEGCTLLSDGICTILGRLTLS